VTICPYSVRQAPCAESRVSASCCIQGHAVGPTLAVSATVRPVESPIAVQIQIWAPGLDSAWLADGLVQARLQVLPLGDPAEASAQLPLLIAYADPVGRLAASVPLAAGERDASLLTALPQLERSVARCRLVNLGCAVLPTLVAWVVESVVAPPAESTARFAGPDPFEALLAMAWLQEHPGHLQSYQALESHPLAAALDGRPPDSNCLMRYQQAASMDALLKARQERTALEADLEELAQQLAPLQEQQLEGVALREQVALLQARLQQTDALRERCSELQLSLQAQQLDLDQLARRQALLEQLVRAGSEASHRLQGRLAQALA
jgi:hypothetical protein